MTNSVFFRDAQILQKAMRKSIAASPDAFLKTVDDVDEKPIDYWVNEILSSTWAVMTVAVWAGVSSSTVIVRFLLPE